MSSRVVLVRDARSATGGGGCCSGNVRPFDEGGAHGHAPRADEVGEVYRALRAALPGEVAAEVVSPANWLWLLPALLRDGRQRGLRGRALLRSVRTGMTPCSLVVDGAVLSCGRLPEPAAAVAMVTAELAALPGRG